MKDWWSEGDRQCVGGGLGYWLAVPSVIIDQIRNDYVDPDVQQCKLMEAWMQLDVFPSWHRHSRAVQRVGETQLASTMTTYEQSPPGMYIPCWVPSGLVVQLAVVCFDVYYICWSFLMLLHVCVYLCNFVIIAQRLCTFQVLVLYDSQFVVGCWSKSGKFLFTNLAPLFKG